MMTLPSLCSHARLKRLFRPPLPPLHDPLLNSIALEQNLAGEGLGQLLHAGCITVNSEDPCSRSVFFNDKTYLLILRDNDKIRSTGELMGSVGAITVRNGKPWGLQLFYANSTEGGSGGRSTLFLLPAARLVLRKACGSGWHRS